MASLSERLGGTATAADAAHADISREQELRQRLLASRSSANRPSGSSNDRGKDINGTYDSSHYQTGQESSRRRSRSPIASQGRRGSPSYQDEGPSSSSQRTPVSSLPPRPQMDRWVPPPRPDPQDRSYRDRGHDQRREDGADQSRWGPRRGGGGGGGGRYFDTSESDPHSRREHGRDQGPGAGDSRDEEYGRPQWRRQPRDPYSSVASSNSNDGGFFASRNEQRKQSTLSIWPPSPKEPFVDSEEEREKERQERHRRKKKEKERRSSSGRHRSESSRKDSSKHRHHHHRHERSEHSRRKRLTDEDEDVEERDARHRSRRSSRPDRDHDEKDKEKRHSHHHHRRSSKRHKEDSSDTDSDSEDEEDRRRRRKRRSDYDDDDVEKDHARSSRYKSKHSSSKREEDRASSKGHHRSPSLSASDSESELESSASDDRRRSRSHRSRSRTSERSSSRRGHAEKERKRSRSPPGSAKDAEDEEGEEEIGPVLPRVSGAEGKPVDARSYGGALLPGEGTAMASFVQDGKRIPRRGEIGLTSDQIEAYEKAGYVMSGSRHHRMNAVRIRKENQVISAEEKRTLLRLQAEEKAKKEREVVTQFKELLDSMTPSSHAS